MKEGTEIVIIDDIQPRCDCPKKGRGKGRWMITRELRLAWTKRQPGSVVLFAILECLTCKAAWEWGEVCARGGEMIYTCQVIEESGQKVICGAKHKTMAAAERCIRSDSLRPGMFREYMGQIIEVEGNKVVKRYAAQMKTTLRGRTGTMRAVWVELPAVGSSGPQT